MLQRADQLSTNVVDGADAFDAVVGRCLGIASGRPAGVVLDQRFRLLVIDRQAVAHGGFAVVFTLDQGFAGDVVLAFFARRVVLDRSLRFYF